VKKITEGQKDASGHEEVLGSLKKKARKRKKRGLKKQDLMGTIK